MIQSVGQNLWHHPNHDFVICCTPRGLIHTCCLKPKLFSRMNHPSHPLHILFLFSYPSYSSLFMRQIGHQVGEINPMTLHLLANSFVILKGAVNIHVCITAQTLADLPVLDVFFFRIFLFPLDSFKRKKKTNKEKRHVNLWTLEIFCMQLNAVQIFNILYSYHGNYSCTALKPQSPAVCIQ